ncbi:Crp/Fnr family transcriptional regulator [Magnetospirillum sp. UT-4]|uniref:Crp/Fnr family transcriptional regulator n=1 Tax=Magnetospirillum sp. UT-4 TaxID=2681467 RepID=UPI001380F72A|nr:Crp/Fnr family transcriptional regulator [Magnetospirillum sp. UT-4]CAA7626454.1 Cyclic nucleotide-binding:Bacterial regulatory protein, Crp [Magnetospirillum sp. UT-4]
MRKGQIEAAWLGRAECRDCGIRHLVLFADLQEADFDLIHLPIEELRVETGGTLYQEGDAGTAAFTIRSGLVKLVQYLADGNQRIVRLLRPGSVAGLEVLAGHPYEHTAVVLQEALVCRLPREVVERLNRETPRLHRQLMNKWSDSLRLADEWLTDLNTGTARQRVARLFLHLLQVSGDGRCRLLGREDVGAILSVTTETASRTVADFKRMGVVTEVAGNSFTVDRDRLEDIAAGE